MIVIDPVTIYKQNRKLYKGGISIYIILLKRLSKAFFGSVSVKIRKAITRAITCLLQRLKDINGISDQMMLINM